MAWVWWARHPTSWTSFQQRWAAELDVVFMTFIRVVAGTSECQFLAHEKHASTVDHHHASTKLQNTCCCQPRIWLGPCFEFVAW